MTAPNRGRKVWQTAGLLGLAILMALAFTLGSLDVPFAPSSELQLLILLALSTFIFIALLILGLILTRSLLRMWGERRAGQLGSRFKTKMVLGAMGISLLPIIFLFFVSYSLLNRTLGKWFPRPLEIASEQSQELLNEMGRSSQARLVELATLAGQLTTAAQTNSGQARLNDRQNGARDDHRTAPQSGTLEDTFKIIHPGADALWVVNAKGEVTASATAFAAKVEHPTGTHVRFLQSGAEVWQMEGVLLLAGSAPFGNQQIFVGRRIPDDFLKRYAVIEAQRKTYGGQQQQLRVFKRLILLTLFLVTLLLVFSVTWTALYLSKQVTVPIGALAEATREISQGNFDYRVTVQAQDELGTLVNSFNQMTAQLAESREKIQDFNRSLQQAVNEIEQRRRLMETILENIPTGVLSVDESGAVNRVNPAVVRIFGETGRGARAVADLVGAAAAPMVERLMRRSRRMGTASQDIEIALPGRVLHAAVTVSSLGPRRTNPGFVVVIDDLSELLHAQKSAAWQEVAQRIAHEIKNPLTPIQLSAQRLNRFLARQPAHEAPRPGELEALVSECAGLIEREVATLEGLVDEFTQFARFPQVKPVSSDLNAILSSAVEVFSGRLDGVNMHLELAEGLPAVKADPELLRRVLVNLIDNAAEAMEAFVRKELEISTRLGAQGETVEIIVADTGHGIAPSDKDKLFLPHFSTRERGTGLGLAIAERIISEHHGTIRVEDNLPRGSRFVIRLPLAEAPAVTPVTAAAGALTATPRGTLTGTQG